MKKIPNIITILRIVFSLILLFLDPGLIPFLIIYCLAGFTDILDGFIARKTHTTSKLGAKLDSIADLVFVAVLIYSYISDIIDSKITLIIIAIIALIRIISIVIALVRYHKPAFIHTYLNKLTGLVLFFFPFLLLILEIEIIAYIIGSIALLASLEELMINLTSLELNLDRKSIILKKTK